MNPSWEAIVVLAGLLGTMAAYAIFTGADFGGGIWDLLAGSTEKGAEPRAEIDASVTPVWEGNQTWIVLGLVLVWTAFPTAFSAVMTTLFAPLAASLLGLLLRGIGFAFRHESEELRTQQINGVLFGAASLVAPFFLGVSIGAVASGRVSVHQHANTPGAWVAPTPLLTGALFVASCAYIGAVYLVGDSKQRGKPTMVRYFSRRALLAGAVTGGLAAADFILLHYTAPYVFGRLIGPALPLVIVSVAAGLAAMVLIVFRLNLLLRMTSAVAVIAVIAAWGLAQYPWLLPTSLSLRAGSAPVASLNSEIFVLGLAAVIVAPAFAYLYWLQQHGRLHVTEASQSLRRAAAAENRADELRAAAQPRGGLVAAAVTAAAGAALLGDLLRRGRRGAD